MVDAIAKDDFDRCPRCDDYAWLSRHICPPIWECRMVSDSDDLSFSRVHTIGGGEDAAEKFVKKWFWNGGYESFKDGDCVIVEVRDGPGRPIEIIEVRGELSMDFNTSEGDLQDAIEEAETDTAKAVAVALVSLQLLAWLDEAERKRTLDWRFRSCVSRAEFHFAHWCELRGVDPDDDTQQHLLSASAQADENTEERGNG